MGAIRSDWLSLAEDGARRCEAFEAMPDEGRGPGVLVLHDMFGVKQPFRDLAEAYARRGMPAIVPNQFWRSAETGEFSYDGDHAAANARLDAFDWDAAVTGMREAIAFLRRSPRCNGKVLALGFCFSGVLAYLAASRTDVDAAAGLYALGISRYVGEARRIACPTQLHYGLADDRVPMSEVDAVAAGVAGHDPIALYRYPGAGHSFANPVRPMYHPAATKLAFERVDALLAGIA